MRTIVQRVREASVVVDAKCVAEIGQGMLLLVGFEDADTPDDLQWTAQKVANLRIFDDAVHALRLCKEGQSALVYPRLEAGYCHSAL